MSGVMGGGGGNNYKKGHCLGLWEGKGVISVQERALSGVVGGGGGKFTRKGTVWGCGREGG